MQENAHSINAVSIASYILAGMMIITILGWHLLPAAFSGMLVYAITRRIECSLLFHRSWSHRAKMLSVAIVSIVVCLLLFTIGLCIAMLLNKHNGLSWLLVTVAEMLEAVRKALPSSLQDLVPSSLADLQHLVSGWLKQHSQQISGIGFRGVKATILAIIGMVIGAMVAWSGSYRKKQKKPLSAALLARLKNLESAFENVVFAQIKISALNTSLTAIYLLILLPLFDQHLPYTKTLIALTFIVGLMPVIGNLISNTAIVAVSATTSFDLAIASLVFLVIIHKLEYFVNAKIIGSRINARAWELLITMLIMETVFGMAGVVAAPIIYAYIKNELIAANLIGIEEKKQ